jgi:alpha-beta hydrolase superfamily lysophospholipase
MTEQLAKLGARRFWIRLMLLMLAAILILLGWVYLAQREFIYFPTRLSRATFEASVKDAFGDRATILAPFDAVVVEPPPELSVRATAILFHGNASLGIDRAYYAPVFAQRGIRLILAEYPGYGPRAGRPSEKALVEDADALYGGVLQRYPDAPILVVGESLGTGVAVQVAVDQGVRPPARLVLLTPFLSLAETAARAYWFLPARYLVRDRFDSASRIAHYKRPVAILVAERDEVVGAVQGRALAEVSRLRGETVLVELPEAGHNSWTALMTDAQWTSLLGLPVVR